LVVQQHIDASGDGIIHRAGFDIFHGIMDGHQRRRTSGVGNPAWPPQVIVIADSGSDDAQLLPVG
jgi:hypothetical protein